MSFRPRVGTVMDRKTTQAVITVVVGLLVLVAGVIGYVLRPQDAGSPTPSTEHEGPASPPDPSVHLALGNPSGATDDPAHRDNYLMRKPYFALSYNNSKGTANWVSWRLEEED